MTDLAASSRATAQRSPSFEGGFRRATILIFLAMACAGVFARRGGGSRDDGNYTCSRQERAAGLHDSCSVVGRSGGDGGQRVGFAMVDDAQSRSCMDFDTAVFLGNLGFALFRLFQSILKFAVGRERALPLARLVDV